MVSGGTEAEIRTLLSRGRAYAEVGDPRAAASFFAAAIRAGGSFANLPAPLLAELRSAQAYVARAAEDFQLHIERALAAEQAGSRLGAGLDMLLGRKPLDLPAVPYPQRPSTFHFPGLPHRSFYEREEFGWAAGLETETPAIKAELAALIESGASFRAYVEDDEHRPRRDFHGMHGDESWGALYLWKDGSIVEENAARCPRTMEALARVPLSRIGSRTPSVLFSMLRPGAHIPPHHGMLNCRLICHLPLIVPAGCWLRVGAETREWEEGRLLVFDDSVEHEARNPTTALRVVLLFDVWRPELTKAERRGMSAIFTAIDKYPARAAPQQGA